MSRSLRRLIDDLIGPIFLLPPQIRTQVLRVRHRVGIPNSHRGREESCGGGAERGVRILHRRFQGCQVRVLTLIHTIMPFIICLVCRHCNIAISHAITSTYLPALVIYQYNADRTLKLFPGALWGTARVEMLFTEPYQIGSCLLLGGLSWAGLCFADLL